MATSHLFFTTLSLLFLSLCSLTLSQEGCHPNDKKALLQIKKDLNNPKKFITWKPHTNCCEDWIGVNCGEANRITILELTHVDLRLPLPAAVGDLPYLYNLIFRKTNLTGAIPPSISKLSRLNFLDLRWNLLSGNVPAFLGHLENLAYIGLSFNQLTGSIPASIGLLPKLEDLYLDRNKLTGSIPETLADLKAQDFGVYLSHNQLSGPIPRNLIGANFSTFDVSRNKLEGDLSFLFGKNKSLRGGDFSRNQFKFDLSNVEFPISLVNLDFNHNKIFGRLPKDLSSTTIRFLNVSYNRLCGKIPKLNDDQIQTFDYTTFFHNRCLCGKPLPSCK
ncbi:hypothetical protein C2S53_010995 [Perilla frutescens var. hirtella]|uniref:Leucine-rich repeat-containing N-terminal plant-type domain-containing protein n=1 Tax=Perilla frutescens var. hirtella TaxID=608512 RepID=A0AAD4PA51_PERFH|nr:hypothetical protein C2S53_010995 [Perilla frutescens var. hirtella]